MNSGGSYFRLEIDDFILSSLKTRDGIVGRQERIQSPAMADKKHNLV